MMDLTKGSHEKSKLVDINPHLTCFLCKGYYIDATTISECLHSFCRSCIIKFLHEHSYCPICEVIINKAKPNLKLDKTLQDIVYKLVPELFLNEMKRRQRFYQNHPDLATKVTPEERGEDTERTIFNPRDTISLSIEYISDDSTPGALLMPELIGKREDVHNKNKAQFEENEKNSAIKRFLQCPGMCRVAVLKKFIRNKYNVDTNQYHIDILYKRVPLPDHYTLIDIAYIYSYKRNEPMKFFFKITDKSLVNDNFDYLIQPQLIKHDQICNTKVSERKAHKNVKSTCNLKNDNKSEKLAIISEKPAIIANDKICDNEKKEESEAKDNKSNKPKEEYSNLTLDRSNNMEIITKIQKVSNKNGLPIGIKITKQMVKKSGTPKSDKNLKDAIKKEEPLVAEPPAEVDEEKSNFLKSFELTAKNAIPTTPPKSTVPKETLKRKNSFEKPTSKKPKKSSESAKNLKCSDILQVVNNVNENVSKIMDTDKTITGNNLQALLFDSYKINIPASLSVTVKSEKDNNTPSSIQKPVQNYIEILKIPDRPSTPSSASLKNSDFSERPKLSILERLNTSVEVNKVEIKVEDGDGVKKVEKIDPYDFCQNEIKEELKDEEQTSKSSYQSTAAMKSKTSPSTSVVSSKPKENLAKLNPRTPQTFQKMFEEAIKKPEFNSKFQTVPAKTDVVNNKQTPKRRISDIASKLIKKTKMDQEKNDDAGLLESKSETLNEVLPISKSPLNVPRITNKRKAKLSEKVGNPPLKDFNTYISSKISPQTVTSLHSPSLGLNYTVSVTQQSSNNLGKSVFPAKPSLEIETRLSMSPKLPNTSTSPRHPLHSPVRQEIGTLLNIPRAYSTSPKIASPQQSNKSSISPKTKSPNKDSACKTSSSSRKSPASIAASSPSVSKINSKSVTPHGDNQLLTSNQLLEKYNIQNLAQLTANFNFPANMCVNPTQNQLAAMHQALILRHFEMQNHQNWLNMNPGPLMQYEKYLQSLSKS